MSEVVSALLLGIVQGLTEFLPVSSSGHLELLNHLLGEQNALDSDLTLVLIVHVGTALSILFIFRRDILDILVDLIKFRSSPNSLLSFEIFVSMIPALIVGLLFERQIEELFEGGILLVGVCLICTGLVLWLTPKSMEEADSMIGWKKALLIGVAQAIAILPGISRSGMTIALALMLGVSKKSAARFSFLMVLPIIFGKMILDMASGEWSTSPGLLVPIIVALVTSFLVGVVACQWMIRLVQSQNLKVFAIYCFLIGAITIGISLNG